MIVWADCCQGCRHCPVVQDGVVRGAGSGSFLDTDFCLLVCFQAPESRVDRACNGGDLVESGRLCTREHIHGSPREVPSPRAKALWPPVRGTVCRRQTPAEQEKLAGACPPSLANSFFPTRALSEQKNTQTGRGLLRPFPLRAPMASLRSPDVGRDSVLRKGCLGAESRAR